MDRETMHKKIIDLGDDELTALGFLGDQAPAHVVEFVEAIKASPARLGYMTCFMVECVKEHPGDPVDGPAPQSPVSPTATLYSSMSDDLDAHTIVPPHLITKFERQFYYNGISGNPPELLYRSDLDTNPFYVPTPGAPFSKIPTKIPNGVFGTELNAVWDQVAPEIIASMKASEIRYSALQTVRFTIIQDGNTTIGPVVIWIAVRPGTTNAEKLRDFTPNILRILSEFQITGVVVEWPPKGGAKKKAPSDGTSTPQTPSISLQLSYLDRPRPFKNPNYTKNHGRRAKNLKTVLAQERERERAEREARMLQRATGENGLEQLEEIPTYTTIEAPPSVLPHIHLCDITGLEAPYTDPATGLRFHDKSVYEIVKGLSTGLAKEYLAARGVNPVVK